MPSSGGLLATIPVGMVPKWVAVGPDGRCAYVTMSDSPESGPPEGAVAVIDTTTNTLTATIAVGILLSGVVVAPYGCHAYVSNLQHGAGVVSVIDTTTNAVVDSITVSAPTGLTQGLAITPDGRQLYVAAESADGLEQSPIRLTISGICQVCGAFSFGDLIETRDDGLAEASDGECAILELI